MQKRSLIAIHLGEVLARRATMLWGRSPEDFGAFREVAVRFWPVERDMAVYGSGGTLQIGALPLAGVRDFQLRYTKPALTIEWGRLSVGGESEVQVSGVFQFAEPGSMDLKLGFHRCPLMPFLPAEMHSKLAGTFEMDARVQKELGDDKPATYGGPVRIQRAVARNFAALTKLAAFTHEPRLKALHFETLRAQYTYTAPLLEVRDFVAEVPGLFQVEGEGALAGDKVQATLQLGVSGGLLDHFPGAREEVFTKRRDDYFWTTVKIGGTKDKPVEDLSPRLVAAAKKAAVKTVLKPVTKPLELLKKPVEAVGEFLKGLFD